MTARQRPGQPLLEDERLAATLGAALDMLAVCQTTPRPHPGLEDVVEAVRYVRGQLIKRIPPEVDHGQEVGK